MRNDWLNVRSRVVEVGGVKWRHTRIGDHEEFEPVDSDAVLVTRAGARTWEVCWFYCYARSGRKEARLDPRVVKAFGSVPPLASAARHVKRAEMRT